MHIVVTGGTGFIGSHLARALRGQGHRVITLSRTPTSHPDHYAMDITEPSAQALAADAEAIVHLASPADASSSLDNPFNYCQTIALGTLNMLEAARQGGAHLILASTQRVYRPSAHPLAEDDPLEPAEPYAYAKLVAEKWVEMYNSLYGLGATVLRFFSVYGPGQLVRNTNSGVLSILTQRALRGEDLHVDGGYLRDFTHVDDVVLGVLLALSLPIARGRTYNIATGRATELVALAHMVKEVTQAKVRINIRKREEPIHGYVANIQRAERELGYHPRIDLYQGLQSYVRWLQSQNTSEGAADIQAAGR